MLRLLPLIALLFACGSRPPTTPPPPPVTVELEPEVLEVDSQGNVEAYNAQELFDEGQAGFERQDWETCDARFGRLLEKFPQSRYVHPALYNRGLCLERLRLHSYAAKHFRRHARLSAEDKDRLDGLFRLGFNLVRAREHVAALHLYDALLEEPSLGTADKAECYLRRGTAYAELARFGQAEKDLKLAMALTQEAYEGEVRGSELMAESHFRRGEIYQRLSHDVTLKLPVSSMKGDLAAKTRFFRQAQSSYIDALNVRHSYWATAAGLKLGDLYEQFYRDILAAEVPDDFDAETRSFYVLELKKQLQPILQQSLFIYEKNITMSERIGAQNEWVAETEARVQRLRSLIEANTRAASAEEPSLKAPPSAPADAPASAPPSAPSRG